MSSWKIFKKILTNKKESFFSKDRKALDKNLPLGFRLGGMVTLDQSEFIINRDKLQFEFPGKEHIVKAWGEFELYGYKFYRFYLLGKENGAESIIEISTLDGKTKEVKLFRNYDEVVPVDDDEWGTWLDEDAGILSDNIFEVTENEDSEDEFVNVYSQSWDSIVNFVETVYLDQYGDNTVNVNVNGSLYGRDINEGATEFLMAGAEETEDGASIRMLIGINIGEADLKVI